jgi:hypothetical protein
MKQQVETLVKVQELDAVLADIRLGGTSEPEATASRPPSAAKRLRAQRAQLARGLSTELLRRYERLRQRYLRAVVETERGVCMGCFTKRPTAMASREGGLETCERCGRILRRVEPAGAPPPEGQRSP